MVYGGINKSVDAATEIRRNPASKHRRFSLSMYGDEQADGGRDSLPNPFREAKFSGANENREIFISFPVQLTARRMANLIIRLIHTLAII